MVPPEKCFGKLRHGIRCMAQQHFWILTGDSVPDIIIGGRAAELQAINGRNGKVIWAFFPEGNSMEPRKKGWFNFYNPQIIPDQNRDGVEDILVSNGGDILAAPFDPHRPNREFFSH